MSNQVTSSDDGGRPELAPRTWVPLVTALVIFLAIFTEFFPGLMSFDSLQQFRQVENLAPLTNSHPAAMVYMWKLTNCLFHGPSGLYLFHLSTFFLALVVFTFTLWKSLLPRVLTILFVALNPAVTIHLIHIWKDASLEAAAFLGVALLLSNERRAVWWKPATALLFLGYALGVRWNAISAILPLLVWAGWRLSSLWFGQRARKIGVVAGALALVISVVGLVTYVNNSNVKSGPVLGTIALWDMVGVSVRTGQNLIPDHYLLPVVGGDGPLAGTPVTKENVLDLLRDRYKPYLNYTSYEVVSPYQYSTTSELLTEWSDVIRQHPGAYLEHRLELLKIMFAIGNKVYYPLHPGIDRNEFGFALNAAADGKSFAMLERLAKSGVMAGVIYLVLAFVCLGVLWRRCRRSRWQGPWAVSGLVICGAGILHWLPLALLATAADYRYLNLGILFTVVALLLLIKDVGVARARARDAGAGERTA